MKQPTKVIVVVVPASGPTTTKEVDAEAPMTVGQALEKAGIDPKNMEMSVGGKPVQLDQPLEFSAKIELADKYAPRVTATERPSGS